MIDRLLLFGATGDLAGRFLFPALAELSAAGRLPDGFRVLGTGRDDLDDDAFRSAARRRLEIHAADVPGDARESVLRALHYRPADVSDPTSVGALLDDGSIRGAAVAAYLALPPAAFATAVRALAAAGLPAGSRIVVEKPFGEDLASAVALNRLIAEVTGSTGERAVFRVDHMLGMATVHNLLGVRFANRVIEPLWNSTHIEQVDIVWDESIGLEGRAGYYDHAGALKDVVQNHLVQILCAVAMEPPPSLAERDVRDCKVDLLRAVRAQQSARARYTAGPVAVPPEGASTDIPAYVDEAGVDPTRQTETFAEVMLTIDNARWAGTRFLLRTGKALRNRTEVIVRFRPAAHAPFPIDTPGLSRNELRIGLDGPATFSLHLTGSSPGPPARLAPLTPAAQLPAAELPAYSHVFLDVLTGTSALSVSADEAELAWHVVTPVLQAWADEQVPLQEYAAGSAGPPSISPLTDG
jgi:glucose-6-phosphate 1-dehydrogenase